MKKAFLLFLLLGTVILAANPPKYIFLFIGDGMSTPQRIVAEEFSKQIGRGPLAINGMKIHATTKTASTNSLVTDSAAAATAIACGSKTRNGIIGMDEKGEIRLESVAELAHKKGMKVGIVTSITINHATPAGFYGHRAHRGQYYELGLDMVNSGFEYFAGGGVSSPDDKKSPEYKGNIYDYAKEKGYTLANDRASFDALKPGASKVICSGSTGPLPYAIDKGEEDTIPSLAEYTAKGIDLLYTPDGMFSSSKGFFMMVEGGCIDVGGHSNDAPMNLREVLALDDAVKVALDFAQKHPDDTLVIVTGDHETGGMSLGFAGTGYAMYVDRLAHQKAAIGTFRNLYKEQSKKEGFSLQDAKLLLQKYFGFKFDGDKADPMYINDKEMKTIEEAFANKTIPEAARKITAAKAGIGWTTGAHTGLPALTTVSGASADTFSGFLENTDIANRLKTLLK